MPDGEVADRGKRRHVFAAALGLVFTALFAASAWSVLAACGAITPFGPIVFPWCNLSPGASSDGGEADRAAILMDQVAQLERNIRDPDRCGERVAALQPPPTDRRKPEPKPEPKKEPPVAKEEPKQQTACATAEGKPQPVDIYFLQDLTASFADDIVNLRGLVGTFIQRLQSGAFGKDVRIGVGSFLDKPHPKFGGPGHYVFKNHLPLTPDISRMDAVVSELRVLKGGDSPEAQYEALIEMVGNRRAIGFRSGVRSFVVVVTDAAPHVAGDWPPNPSLAGRPGSLSVQFSGKPEDGVADGNPLDEDYPSAQQVMSALRSADITPIFLVSGRSLPIYEAFVRSFGRGVSMPISSDSSDLIEVLFSGLQKACADPKTTAK